MFVHSVYYWLKPDLAAADRAAFADGLRTMAAIPSVVHAFPGTPAATDRPIIDRSYTHGLVLVFRDLAGHDAFQTHPIHLAFREVAQRCCQRVLIYDFEDRA